MQKDEIWDAAEFLGEWDGGNLRYKLYSIPRNVLDDDSDEPPAILLHGLDSGSVRRVDVLIDHSYGREIDHLAREQVERATGFAPEEFARLFG